MNDAVKPHRPRPLCLQTHWTGKTSGLAIAMTGTSNLTDVRNATFSARRRRVPPRVNLSLELTRILFAFAAETQDLSDQVCA